MAANKWRSSRLGDLVEIKHGWPFKSEHFHEDLTGRPIVVSVGNFRYAGGFRFAETSVKEYRDSYPKEYELAPGDTLLIMTCQTAGGEILGIPARVPNDGRTYLHNQRLGKAVVRGDARVAPEFLYWLFLWQDFNRELVTSASGTKILHTAPSRIEAFRFHLPPKDEQRAIAHILGTLDDKIELNRRMSETLEAMARALFKSWFVDFDPVRAKSVGRDTGLPEALYDCFPARFADSDLGQIPEGWLVQPLGHWVKILSGGTPLKSETRYWDGDIPWISPKVMNSIHADEADTQVTSDALGNGTRLAPAGSTLVMVRGMGLHQGVRVSQARWPVAFNQDVKALVGSSVDSTLLFFALLDAQNTLLGRVESSGHGTGKIPSEVLLALPLVVPPREVQARLFAPLRAFNDRIAIGRSEARTLAVLRDTLLPNLISGELRINDAERFVEDIL